MKKGVIIATAVAASFVLAGCASQGAGSSACGEPTAVPVAAPAPAPMNSCKNMSSCKQVVKKKHHHRHHVKKAVDSSSTTTTTTTTSGTGTDTTH